MTIHSTNLSDERLMRLSDEVSRIAGTLAKMSGALPSAVSGLRLDDAGDAPDISPETVTAVIRARRLRDRYFPGELFADPAWDMMLELLEAELMHRRVAISNLCTAADVPATTALRWLKTLVDKGLVMRRPDSLDGRRVYVELASDASRALRYYFAQVAGPSAI